MGCGIPFLSLQQLAIILSKKNAASSHSVPFCKNKGFKLSNQPKMIPHSKSINFPFLPNSSKNLQIVLPMTSKTKQLPASYFGSTRSSTSFPSLPLPFRCSAGSGGSTGFAWSFLVVVWWCIWRFIVFPIKGFDSSTNFTKKNLDFVRKKNPGGLQGHYKKKITRLIYIDPVLCLWSDRRKQSVTKWLI